MIITHIDDFWMAGIIEFLDKIENELRRILTFSKVEKEKF